MPRRWFVPISLAGPLALLVLSASARQAAPETAGPLKIVDALFEDYDGWPRERLQMPAGGEVVLTFRAEGFERAGGINSTTGLPEDRVSLDYEIELRDPDGVLVVPVDKGDVRTLLSVQDEKWRPLVRWSAKVPAWAPPGRYPVQVRLYDEIGDQRTEQTLFVSVEAEPVPASETLTVQRVEFARSEDGPWTPRRVFALRDPVNVRYKVAGFQVSLAHRVWVEQDWSVLDAEGREIVSQQAAAREMSEEFYPPRFIRTNFQLQLTDSKPGDYTLRITVRDRVGEQETTVEAPFSLRP